MAQSGDRRSVPREGEAVDHPGHYGGDGNPHEVIRVMESWLTPEEFIGAMKFNAFKYLARHRAKGGLEDLRKAQFYQNYLIDFIKRTGADSGGRKD